MRLQPPSCDDDYARAPTPVVTATVAGEIEHTDSGGPGRVLLALHGGMGGYDQSWLLARALAADVETFRVIAVSRPGYLGTALSVGRSAEAQADALAALLDRLDVAKVLGGRSVGGRARGPAIGPASPRALRGPGTRLGGDWIAGGSAQDAAGPADHDGPDADSRSPGPAAPSRPEEGSARLGATVDP